MSRAHGATASMSIKSGTEKLLALVNVEIEKAVSRYRTDLQAATGLIAALRDRCCLLEQEFAHARSSAVPSNLLLELEHAKDELSKMHEALARGGFILDSDNVIKFGPVFATLALDFSRVSSQSMGVSNSLEGAITSLGVIGLMSLMKRTLEENNKMVVVWKDKCSAAEKERDEFKAKAIDSEVLKNKDSEIDNLRDEVNSLKQSLVSLKQQVDHSSIKRSRSKGPSGESSDSDVPLALTSKPRQNTKQFSLPSTFVTSADEGRSSTLSDTREHEKAHSAEETTSVSPKEKSKQTLSPSASGQLFKGKKSLKGFIESDVEPLFDDTPIACSSPPASPPQRPNKSISRTECEASSKPTPAEKMQMSTSKQDDSPIIKAVSSSFPTSPLQQAPAPKATPVSESMPRKAANDDTKPGSSAQSKPSSIQNINTPTVIRNPRAALTATSKPLLAVQPRRNGLSQTPTSVDNKTSTPTSGSSNFIPKQLPIDIPKVNKVTLGTGKPKTAPKTPVSVEQSKASSQKLPSFHKVPQKPTPTPSTSTRPLQWPPLGTSASAKRASTSIMIDRPRKRIRTVSDPCRPVPIFLPKPRPKLALPTTNNKVPNIPSTSKQAPTSSRPAHN